MRHFLRYACSQGFPFWTLMILHSIWPPPKNNWNVSRYMCNSFTKYGKYPSFLPSYQLFTKLCVTRAHTYTTIWPYRYTSYHDFIDFFIVLQKKNQSESQRLRDSLPKRNAMLHWGLFLKLSFLFFHIMAKTMEHPSKLCLHCMRLVWTFMDMWASYSV